jgi:hypothetical protein
LLFAFHGGLQNFGFDWLAELWEDEELLLFEGGQLSKKGDTMSNVIVLF